jgi:hypothetical protein
MYVCMYVRIYVHTYTYIHQGKNEIVKKNKTKVLRRTIILSSVRQMHYKNELPCEVVNRNPQRKKCLKFSSSHHNARKALVISPRPPITAPALAIAVAVSSVVVTATCVATVAAPVTISTSVSPSSRADIAPRVPHTRWRLRVSLKSSAGRSPGSRGWRRRWGTTPGPIRRRGGGGDVAARRWWWRGSLRRTTVVSQRRATVIALRRAAIVALGRTAIVSAIVSAVVSLGRTTTVSRIRRQPAVGAERTAPTSTAPSVTSIQRSTTVRSSPPFSAVLNLLDVHAGEYCRIQLNATEQHRLVDVLRFGDLVVQT